MFDSIIIWPLKQLFEICFIFFYEITDNPGVSTICLSFAVTLFSLPIYIIAESWQNKERVIEKKLEPEVNKIKAIFKGNEQYMILSTYYKQNHYHPIMALRSAFSLFIQVPFFMAAYSFLSSLVLLKGASFLFIKDMGAPDSFFSIGNFSINILPILMTVFNCISGALYSHGHNKREKIQIYGCALLFLIILYNSPSGLVIYWTMNNFLSLVKNIFYKMKNPLKVFHRLAISIFVIISFYLSFKINKIELKNIVYLLTFLIIFSPYILKLINCFLDSVTKNNSENEKYRAPAFVLSCLILTCLTGLTIPSVLIESEPIGFCYIDDVSSPFSFLWNTFQQSIGLFIIYPICFFALFGERIKKLLTLLFLFFVYYGIVNTFCFDGNYGPLDADLTFMEPNKFNIGLKLFIINIVVLVSIIIFILLLFKKRFSIIIPINTIILLSLLMFSFKNFPFINRTYNNLEKPSVISEIKPVLHLSQTEKNVIIFMQDRFISPIVPEIFDENPELCKSFDGFIYYPNTISFGQLTMIGTPGLFGGYDYIPYYTNQDKTKSVRQKHNEALLSMPVAFLREDFLVTVADLPYENFDKQPYAEMYKDYPGINRLSLKGNYSDYWYKKNNYPKGKILSHKIRHNLIMISIFKEFSPFLRRIVYHKEWWNTKRKDQFSKFIDSYSILEFLPDIFDNSARKKSLIIMDNRATHEPVQLDSNYRPTSDMKNLSYSKDSLYQVTVATLKDYAKFIDYLKNNNIYDNTRIIIVSDHGADYTSGKFNNNTGLYFKKESVNPGLLVKDFNSRSADLTSLNTSMEFMTNADTPAIASENLLKEPVNPFTNNNFKVLDKNKHIRIAAPASESTRIRERSYFKIPEDKWVTVHDNIFQDNNWQYLNQKEN